MKAFTKNLTNSTITGYIHEKSGEMPNADIRPAVLVFPGGGYMMCSDREADPVALAYLAEGYNAFILRYTVGIDEPVSKSFADADEAMAYLHSNAGELNIDKDKIAVVGFSAGGHLAACLVTMVKSSRRPPSSVIRQSWPRAARCFAKSFLSYAKKSVKIPHLHLFLPHATIPS